MSSFNADCPVAKWLIENWLHIPYPQEIFTVLHASFFSTKSHQFVTDYCDWGQPEYLSSTSWGRGVYGLGDDDILLGSQNNGNYLGMLELLEQLDPFLAEHMKNYG